MFNSSRFYCDETGKLAGAFDRPEETGKTGLPSTATTGTKTSIAASKAEVHSPSKDGTSTGSTIPLS
jgi:hypothetical protein